MCWYGGKAEVYRYNRSISVFLREQGYPSFVIHEGFYRSNFWNNGRRLYAKTALVAEIWGMSGT